MHHLTTLKIVAELSFRLLQCNLHLFHFYLSAQPFSMNYGPKLLVSRIKWQPELIQTYVVLAEDIGDHHLGPLDRVRTSGDPERLLVGKVGSILNDDNLGSAVLLKLLDCLAAFADDQTNL